MCDEKMINIMYDPFILSKKTESIVTKGRQKKYYRFRPTRFYGGIATADTVGCNLRCVFCWSSNSVWNAAQAGSWYTPEHVADTLQEIAQKKGFCQVRISGGEPTLGKEHLLSVLHQIPQHIQFILETNGLLLGDDHTYVDDLSSCPNLHVRVCLKGCDQDEFSWLTGANKGFEQQLQALTYLRDAKVRFNIALVSVRGTKRTLFQRLQDMGLGSIMVEEEQLTLYPQVRKRLQKAGILSYFE